MRILKRVLASTWLVAFAASAEAQPFTFTSVWPLISAVEHGAMEYADINGDGIYDIVATGNSANQPPFAPRSYVAVAGEGFRLANGSSARRFAEVRFRDAYWQSGVAWTDYDMDGDLDFILTGRPHTGAAFDMRPVEGVARIYRNDGRGTFSSIPTAIQGVYGGLLRVADVDGDGDEDVLVSGYATPDEVVLALYENTGGQFQLMEQRLEPLALGAAEWVDFDSDGDLDLLLGGATARGAFRTRLYRNGGGGQLSEVNTNFPGLAFSAFDWGDYDSDGDLDLALSGSVWHDTHYLEPVSQIWRNDNGTLVLSTIEVVAVHDGDVAWGDYDSDGDLDLLVTGGTNLGTGRAGLVYQNEQGSLEARVAFAGVTASAVTWGDHDGDRDLDLLVTGSNLSGNPLTRIYRNDSRAVNTAPTPPSGLRSTESGRTTALRWTAGSDNETADGALHYNLRIGTSPGASDIMAPYSDLETGRRIRPGRGNAGQTTSWNVRNLPMGTYYWSVQAIDNSFVGSTFAEEASFEVTVGPGLHTAADPAVPRRTSLEAAYPNPFAGAVRIPYELEAPMPVSFEIFNVLGVRVWHWGLGSADAGRHELQWSGQGARGRPLAAGLYLVRMKAGTQWFTQSISLVR